MNNQSIQYIQSRKLGDLIAEKNTIIAEQAAKIERLQEALKEIEMETNPYQMQRLAHVALEQTS